MQCGGRTGYLGNGQDDSASKAAIAKPRGMSLSAGTYMAKRADSHKLSSDFHICVMA